MRRWLTAVALTGVVAMSLAGCRGPGGADGDLTDDWAAVGTPTTFIPDAATCHPSVEEVAYVGAYQPVDCAKSHLAETVYVNGFTGAAADQPTRPAAGSAALRAARAECELKSNDFLGGDWHTGRLVLTLVLPPSTAWNSGARWFRCDLSETGSLDNTKAVNRSGSLKDGLAAGSPLAHSCFDPKLIKEDLNYLEPVACTSTHHAEFAGVYTAPENTGWDAFQRDGKGTHRACLTVIAAFAKVPDNNDLQYRAGSIFYPPSEAEWNAGDRGVRCFLWVGGRPLDRSMRGAGTGALPAS
jgi:hypothetical protein